MNEERKGMLHSRKTKIGICILIACLLAAAVLLIYPEVYERQCRDRIYDDMEAALSRTEKSANIRIALSITKETEGVSSWSCGEIGCGVIFDHKNGYYYALTAAHVVDEKTEFETGVTLDSEDAAVTREYFVMPFESKTYEQVEKESETYIPAEDYYERFASAEVVKASDKCDLAVIRFKSDESYGCLALANEDPKKGERIAVFGKTTELGSCINFGEITSDKYESFAANDGRPTDQILKHNAFEAPGYSGGAVLNEQQEIAGINIGGGTNVFGKFRYGAMIPVDIIKSQLDIGGIYASVS